MASRSLRTPKAVVSWSSGKDAALALHEVRRSRSHDVVGLLTTTTREFDRVSIHGVRSEILRRQAKEIGLPLSTIELPFPCPNEVYENAFRQALARLDAAGIEAVVFGDLFLRDVRQYRERVMEGTGIRPEFPLWGRNTRSVATELLRLGFRAYLVCVDPGRLPSSFAGRCYDARLLSELPAEVDPCGERGEFHTCVVAGPVFRHPIPVRPGPVVERDGFVFADLMPA